MQNATRSACGEGKRNERENEKKSYLARRRLCVAGGAAAEVGGGGVALGRRLQAALQLFRTSVSPFLPMFRSSLFLPFPLFSQSVFLSSVIFYVFLSSRFLSSFGSSSLSPLFFFVLFSFFLPSLLSFLSLFFLSSLLSFLSLFFLPLVSAFLASIYRGQGRCFLQLSWGAAGWSAIGRGCRGSVGGARWLVGHCVRSVGSRRESGRQKFKLKLPFLLLPRCVIGGRR
jgi:hypothetical protein